jgi:hypothetical protein
MRRPGIDGRLLPHDRRSVLGLLRNCPRRVPIAREWQPFGTVPAIFRRTVQAGIAVGKERQWLHYCSMVHHGPADGHDGGNVLCAACTVAC